MQYTVVVIVVVSVMEGALDAVCMHAAIGRSSSRYQPCARET